MADSRSNIGMNPIQTRVSYTQTDNGPKRTIIIAHLGARLQKGEVLICLLYRTSLPKMAGRVYCQRPATECERPPESAVAPPGSRPQTATPAPAWYWRPGTVPSRGDNPPAARQS